MLEVRLKERAGEDPLIATDPFIYKQGTALIRYKLNHDRLYYKAWNELQSLQKQRLQQEAQAVESVGQFADEEAGEAAAAEASSTKQTQSYGQAVLERRVEKARADERKAQAARNDINPASVRE